MANSTRLRQARNSQACQQARAFWRKSRGISGFEFPCNRRVGPAGLQAHERLTEQRRDPRKSEESQEIGCACKARTHLQLSGKRNLSPSAPGKRPGVEGIRSRPCWNSPEGASPGKHHQQAGLWRSCLSQEPGVPSEARPALPLQTPRTQVPDDQFRQPWQAAVVEPASAARIAQPIHQQQVRPQ